MEFGIEIKTPNELLYSCLDSVLIEQLKMGTLIIPKLHSLNRSLLIALQSACDRNNSIQGNEKIRKRKKQTKNL